MAARRRKRGALGASDEIHVVTGLRAIKWATTKALGAINALEQGRCDAAYGLQLEAVHAYAAAETHTPVRRDQSYADALRPLDELMGRLESGFVRKCKVVPRR